MSLRGSSIIDLSRFSPDNLIPLFESAEKARQGKLSVTKAPKSHISLIFFEDSTRTRMSFEAAAFKLGLFTNYFDHKMGTSLAKGETVEETVLNIGAMNPELIVVRGDNDLPFSQLALQLEVPVINGGWGSKGHPTQALLDIYTLWRRWGSLENKKILFVGDIRHSRVVSSHLELLDQLQVEKGFCAPSMFLPKDVAGQVFTSLDNGLSWADAVVVLRVQTERHANNDAWDFDGFRKNFALTKERLDQLRPGLWLLHPGPFNRGVELDHEVLSDPRCLVLDQVKNGVFLRAALMNEILGLGVIND